MSDVGFVSDVTLYTTLMSDAAIFSQKLLAFFSRARRCVLVYLQGDVVSCGGCVTPHLLRIHSDDDVCVCSRVPSVSFSKARKMNVLLNQLELSDLLSVLFF